MFGRRKHHAYYNAHIDIVERLINKLMRGGTGKKIGGKVIRTKGALQGKKLKVMHILEDAFEIIQQEDRQESCAGSRGRAQNAAPIEDTTRVRYGGISYNVAVGISAQRRLDVALRNVALASLISAFKNKKTLAEALADEIILAAQKPRQLRGKEESRSRENSKKRKVIYMVRKEFVAEEVAKIMSDVKQ